METNFCFPLLWFVIFSVIVSTSLAGNSESSAAKRVLRKLVAVARDRPNPGPKPTGLPLHNIVNLFYYVEVFIGNLPQKVKLMLDTADDDIIVVHPKYKPQDQMQISDYFDSSHSETYSLIEDGKHHTIAFQDGSRYTGPYSMEDVRLVDPDSNIEARVRMMVAENMERANFVGGPGYFGLSFASPLKTILSKSGLPKQFSLYLRKEEEVGNLSGKESSGELFIGGFNSEYMASEIFLTTAKVVPTQNNKCIQNNKCNEWTFQVERIEVGDNIIWLDHRGEEGIQGTLAIPDSGCNAIALPRQIFQRLCSYIFNENELHLAEWGKMFLCADLPDNLPKINFVVKGVNLEIGPENYISMKGHFCLFKIRETEWDEVLLGTQFFHKYYTMFDYGKKEISFAKAKQPDVPNEYLQPGEAGRLRWDQLTESQAAKVKEDLKKENGDT